MLARSRRLVLAGAEIETPLLVPGISSKAVAPIPLGQPGKDPKVVAASQVHTETLIQGISESLLVSAYDIHHKLLNRYQAFRRGFTRSPYVNLKVLVIDSGWYEKNVGPSSGQWYHEVGDEALPFEEADYVALVDSLDLELNAVLVGWDQHGAYRHQIESAQEFFGRRTRFTSCVLLKPTGARLHHDFKEMSPKDAGRLRAFNVIGVTEKELGDTVLRRLITLATLRSTLDTAGIDAPIHVFGGLDPMYTPLYFAAGAEIFDSLAWLRYAFRDGMTMSRESAPLLDRTFEKRFPVAVTHVQLQNLDALAELSRELKVFAFNRGDWSKLRRGVELQPAYEAMESALGGRDGR